MKVNKVIAALLLLSLASCGQPGPGDSSSLHGTDSECKGFKTKSDKAIFKHCASYPMHDVNGNAAGFRSTMFEIDSGFSLAEQQKIARALDIAMWSVGEHYIEKYVEKMATTRFMSCVSSKKPIQLKPNGAVSGGGLGGVLPPARPADAARQAELAMGGITILQTFHDGQLKPARIGYYAKPLPELAVADLGIDYLAAGAKQHMNIFVNKLALAPGALDGGLTMTDRQLAGVIFHEWLHRIGYDHPQGQEANTFIRVAGECVASDNR
jgi:hypothetical protein